MAIPDALTDRPGIIRFGADLQHLHIASIYEIWPNLILTEESFVIHFNPWESADKVVSYQTSRGNAQELTRDAEYNFFVWKRTDLKAVSIEFQNENGAFTALIRLVQEPTSNSEYVDQIQISLEGADWSQTQGNNWLAVMRFAHAFALLNEEKNVDDFAEKLFNQFINQLNALIKGNISETTQEKWSPPMKFVCQVCGTEYQATKQPMTICSQPGCQTVINSGVSSQEISELLSWQKSDAFAQPFNSMSGAGRILGTFLGGDLPIRIFGDRAPFLLKKNDKAEIHVSSDGAVLISVSSPVPSIVFIGKLRDANVSVESTIELEKKLRMGKVAGMAATAVFILPQVALLGLIGGVRKQVNKETYILQVGTPNSGGAFLILDELAGRSLARVKDQATPELQPHTTEPTIKDRLNSLQSLLDDGLITNTEFEVKRTEIISQI
jgi:hypothetical protein